MSSAGPIIAAVGAATNFFNNKRAGDAQERASRRNVEQQIALQKDADRQIMEMLGGLEGDSPEQDRRQMYGAFVNALARSRPQAGQSMNVVPMASSRYQQDVGTAARQGDDRSRYLADMFARLDSPARMRQRQGQKVDRVGTSIGMLKRQSEGTDAMTRLRVQNTQANPWVALLGDAMQQYGQWSAGRGSGASATARDTAGNVVSHTRY